MVNVGIADNDITTYFLAIGHHTDSFFVLNDDFSDSYIRLKSQVLKAYALRLPLRGS